MQPLEVRGRSFVKPRIITEFRSDMMNSRLDPGSPNSRKALTNRRSFEVPHKPWTQTTRWSPAGDKKRYESLIWK